MMRRLASITILIVILVACTPAGPLPAVPTTQPAATAGNSAPTAAVSATVAPAASPSPVAQATDTVTAAPPTATLPPAATATPAAYGPDNFPAGVNPLTGQQVSNPALLERRPLAVKVQIYPRGQRWPWGVSLADLVYEYYQNNGLTRLFAIFYGQDAEKVGPIRSARLLDKQLVRMYKTIFAFGGADQRILTQLVNAEFANRLVLEGSHNCPPMCRTDPNGFNFMITNTAELSKYAVSVQGVDNARQDLNGMSFDPNVPAGGAPGLQVSTRYSISAYNRWDFDPASGRYLHFQDNAEDNQMGKAEEYVPFTDQLTNQQVAADNVVILFAPHEFVVKSGASEIVEIGLSGKGKAVAFRDGQAFELLWNRAKDGSILTLTFADGKPYPMKPGNTWFEVIGQASVVEKKAENPGAVWRFVFHTP